MVETLLELEVRSRKKRLRTNNIHQVEQRTRRARRSCEYPGYFGHESSSHLSHIYANPGPLNTYKSVTAVNLSPYVYPYINNPQREADF